MENLTNIEVFNIEITEEGTFAYISFQYLNNKGDLNNGYENIRVPMNLRPLKKSIRGNILVDQSEKNNQDVELTTK
ncbi:hypothetical protein [Chryseobacterium taichungense]|uniref:hypothetical protein n=1 Tax=Chryseobacterium taichungense TaxID=295069 RepID=UPI0028AC2EC8|nr:hypothetical protein [Chryseobacterium taichungense]